MTTRQEALDRLQDRTPLTPEEFHALLPACENNAQLLVDAAGTHALPLPPEYEAVVASNRTQSLRYAEHVLKGPFLLGEAAIATDISIGLQYAERVLKGPFPALVPLLHDIGKSHALVSYAIDAAKTRLTPLAESKILAEPFQACFYARDILKGRWGPLEERLLGTPSNVDLCLRYVKEVIGGPWPEAEHLFFAMDGKKPLHLVEALEYATFVQKPLPKPLHNNLMAYESSLFNFQTRVLNYAIAAKAPIRGIEQKHAVLVEEALRYIEQASHCRWEKIEAVCARNMDYALRYAKATGTPFDLGVPAVFAKKSGPVRYFNILKKMPDSPERDLWMLLASGYARHKDAQKVFQSKGLDYHTVWPLWEGLGLGLDERKELLQSLLAPKVDTMAFDDIEIEPSMVEGLT